MGFITFKSIGNGEWGMGNGKWEMGNGKWENGKWKAKITV